MFRRIDNISWNIFWYSHVPFECENVKESFMEYCQSHITLLWIWIMFCRRHFQLHWVQILTTKVWYILITQFNLIMILVFYGVQCSVQPWLHSSARVGLINKSDHIRPTYLKERQFCCAISMLWKLVLLYLQMGSISSQYGFLSRSPSTLSLKTV